MSRNHTLGILGLVLVFGIGLYIQFGLQQRVNESSENLKLNVLEWINTHKLIFIGVLFILLMLVVIIYSRSDYEAHEDQSNKINFVQKMDPQQYDVWKKINTLNALKELKNSKEYQDYYNNRKAGNLKPIELTESDRIVFSDEEDGN